LFSFAKGGSELLRKFGVCHYEFHNNNLRFSLLDLKVVHSVSRYNESIEVYIGGPVIILDASIVSYACIFVFIYCFHVS